MLREETGSKQINNNKKETVFKVIKIELMFPIFPNSQDFLFRNINF